LAMGSSRVDAPPLRFWICLSEVSSIRQGRLEGVALEPSPALADQNS
jgi:hypothetical protein